MQISGSFFGEGFYKTSFDSKLERTKFHITYPEFDDEYKNQKDFYVLYSCDEYGTLSKSHQIDPLLAFVQAVKLISTIVAIDHFDFENGGAYTKHDKANEISGNFNGKGFLIEDDGIGNKRYDFAILLLPVLEVDLNKYSCAIKIYNSQETIIDTKIYGLSPIEVFHTGCQFIASKIAYFEKY